MYSKDLYCDSRVNTKRWKNTILKGVVTSLDEIKMNK